MINLQTMQCINCIYNYMDIDYITVRGGGEWVQEIKGHGVFRDTNVVITEV